MTDWSSAPAEPPSLPPKPAFDPALLQDPSIPASLDGFRVEGLRRHLRRYGGQLSPRHAIARLEDPAWRAAWDTALATTAGARVWLHGSELGLFALRALQHGAAHARCLEAHPLDARIASGMVHKHFLPAWQARHGEAIRGWTEEQRRTSFDDFTRCIDVVAADDRGDGEAGCDCLVFPQLDHTLLGTGIVKAVRRHLGSRPEGAPVRVLPARATVFAMAVQWTYPGSDADLAPLSRLRWSPYPQPLELGPAHWRALTEPVRVGDIDFAAFSETTWEPALPVHTPGRVDAIVFWFELELGGARLSSAPDSGLRCIRPAVQYTDPLPVEPGGELRLRVRVEESRLHFETVPAPTLPRSAGLPGWYVSMLGDGARNEAYRAAIARAVAAQRPGTVLDIGAGCGLLSMMAAQAGAQRVVGCDTDAAIVDVGRQVVAGRGLDGRVELLHQDCRKLAVPRDLAERADLAIFEMFDCSLIGEGVLHLLAHAREHLLAPGARCLPAAGRLRAMVVEYRIERIWDLDASLLNAYRQPPSFVNVDASRLDYRPLSDAFDVFSFDFAQAGPAPQQNPLRLPAIAAGMAGAVLFWFDLKLDDSCWISNHPAADDAPHWKQGLQLLPEVQVVAGASLPLVAEHDGSSLRFRWQQDALDPDRVSPVPRWDPRWLAAGAELEHQTQALLQHCAQDAGEYAKVAQIAMRLAVDPAAHGLDPVIAQRFAAMFLDA